MKLELCVGGKNTVEGTDTDTVLVDKDAMPKQGPIDDSLLATFILDLECKISNQFRFLSLHFPLLLKTMIFHL